MLDLILKDISDPYIRENFFRLTKFLDSQVLFEGNFELFDISIPQADASFRIKHGLKFIPYDIVTLFVEGDFNYYFRYQEFDREFLYVTASGPVRLRFLAGRLKDKAGFESRGQFDFLTPPLVGVTPAASAPKLIAQFNTDVGTAVGDLVRVNGVNTVTKITTNSSATIPNGIFGIGYNKPSPILIDVIFIGIMTGYAGFTTGNPLFVSTLGVPTHTVPSTGMVQQIGFAISSTDLFLQMMQPLRRS